MRPNLHPFSQKLNIYALYISLSFGLLKSLHLGFLFFIHSIAWYWESMAWQPRLNASSAFVLLPICHRPDLLQPPSWHLLMHTPVIDSSISYKPSTFHCHLASLDLRVESEMDFVRSWSQDFNCGLGNRASCSLSGWDRWWPYSGCSCQPPPRECSPYNIHA